MGAYSVDNKQITKNTMMLYIRMFAIMIVSLYSSRVVLEQLGIEDYGIYNLVAGFVTIFSIISNSLVSAFQRFFNVALGNDNLKKYTSIYTASIDIIMIFGILIFIIGETLGLWFVTTQLNIPSERMDATIWVYQISLLTFVSNLLRTSFSASIIAHEKMKFYSYVGIIDAVLRLVIVFVLSIVSYDKLIIYSLLYLSVVVLLTFVYWIYCRIKFEECRYLHNDNFFECHKELMRFSSWTLLGQSAVFVRSQGEAFFINRIFSVTVNAAMGVANQVTSAVDVFVVNFQTAFNPQLVKSFSNSSNVEHFKLVFRSARFSYFLLLIIAIPLMFNINTILGIWLKEVPKYSDYFCIFILSSHLINVIGTPLYSSIMANGKIMLYQIIFCVISYGGLIVSFVGLYLNFEPYFVSIVSCGVQILLITSRIFFCKKYCNLSILKFSKEVLIPIISVTILSLIISVVLTILFSHFIINIIIEIIMVAILSIYIGMNQQERQFMFSYLHQEFLKK